MVGWGNGLRRLGLGLMISLVWLLGGCFQSDLTLRFDHHHHGQWTQTITLGERNLAVASDALEPWLQRLRGPVQGFGGHLRQTPGTLTLTVPFSTPADLTERFNRVFTAPGLGEGNATETEEVGKGGDSGNLGDGGKMEGDDHPATVLTLPGLGAVPFHLETHERHYGLFSQVGLIYDLDLRSVALPQPSALAAEAREAGVSFQIQAPWGVSGGNPNALVPAQGDATGTRWILPLGKISHIEAQFWLPNWVGLGGLIIAILVLLGYGIRYRWLGPPRP